MAYVGPAIRKQNSITATKRDTSKAGKTVYEDGTYTTYNESGAAVKQAKADRTDAEALYIATGGKSGTKPADYDQIYTGPGGTYQGGAVVVSGGSSSQPAAQPQAAGSGYTEYIEADQGLSKEDLALIQSYRDAAKAGTITWDQANQYANGVRLSAGGYTVDKSGNATTHAPAVQEPAVDDYSEYLKEMYAKNTAAELAALKDSYQQSAADLKAGAAEIPKTYDAVRNQAAAQNALARQSFNEYAIMQGLNTGATGQAALATSAVLQGELADIGARQADAMSENALAQDKLAIAYKNAVDQAEAAGDAELAGALYQEYIRQADAAAQQQAAALEQANWAAQFQAGQQADAKDYAYNLAMTMLGAGVMPDSATLADAGISAAEAAALQRTAMAGDTAAGGGRDAGVRTGGGYDNGSLSRNQIVELQNHYGVTGDGLWGSASKTAAGGLTADEAWAAYQSGLAERGTMDDVLRRVNIMASESSADAVIGYVDSIWAKLSPAERSNVQAELMKYGVAYAP